MAVVGVIFLAMIFEASAAAECEDNWIPFLDSCYHFGEEQQEFVVAEQYCIQHGSHLVHVNGVMENAFVKDWLRKFKATNWWMGLSDELVEGRWVWSDSGELVSFSDWFPGQPNDFGHTEDCAYFAHQSDFQWYDYGCSQKLHAICEKEKTKSAGIEIIG